MNNSRDKQIKSQLIIRNENGWTCKRLFLMHHARLNIVLFFDEQSASHESYICVGGDVSSIPTEQIQKKT
jgi:hypothetical protein